MVLRIDKSQLNDVMPPVYAWWDKVTLNDVSSLQSGSCHLVVCSAKDDDLIVDAPLLGNPMIDKIKLATKLLGWRAKSGCQMVLVEGISFLLVAAPKVKTSVHQRGRQIGLDASGSISSYQIKNLVLCAPEKDVDLCDILEGISEGLFQVSTFKATPKKPDESALPEKVSFWGKTAVNKERLNEAKHMAQAVALTKLLQEAPANWLNAPRFAALARELGEQYNFKVTIGGKSMLEDLGMGSFLSVGQGSPHEPYLIVLEIDGEDNSRTTALIGKGLTFDAGGISIKPSAGMGEMKYDMSGGAAVLGAARFFAGVKPKTKVVCIIGAVENVISGQATRPGDICTAMNGKTIEILNTDAEGRLVLCDLICYARTKYKPELIVDIATLTGAVSMGLGSAGAAILGNDDTAVQRVMAAAKVAGEPLWQLPLWPELEKEVKGDISDYKNIATPNVKAGTIMGAMFLKQFAEESPWVHLDIAATAWNCAATGYPKKGGAAYGLRTLAQVGLERL